MGRHIIFSFQSVGVMIVRFRDHFVKMGFKINAYAWISIFVDCQTCRSVFDKHMHNPRQIG